MMPSGDPWDRFFYPALTQKMDSYYPHPTANYVSDQRGGGSSRTKGEEAVPGPKGRGHVVFYADPNVTLTVCKISHETANGLVCLI